MQLLIKPSSILLKRHVTGVSHEQGRIQGGECEGCIPPPAIFKHVFDECDSSEVGTIS